MPTLSLTVNSNNQVTNPGYTYDLAGNVTSDGSDSYLWNAEGRMVSTAGYTYTYDGDGRRVKKADGRNEIDAGRGTQSSNRKLYWYGAGGAVLAESDLGGNITAEYIYFNGQRIARRAPVSGNVSYFFADRLGSARVITNATGAVTEESDYLPYGTERPLTDPHTADNDYKFTGHERDSESGLDHTLNRQYSSNTGRWLSADPKGGNAGNPQSWNRYSYGNNPCNQVDRDGGILGPPPGEAEPPEPAWGGFWSQPPRGTVHVPIDPTPRFPGLTAKWDKLSEGCQTGLTDAMKGSGPAATALRLNALNRAMQAADTLKSAAADAGIDWRMLAAIGVRESGFQNVVQTSGTGLGFGVFQFDITKHTDMSLNDFIFSAMELGPAAKLAANTLATNAARLTVNFPNFTPDQLTQATAASWNLGPNGFSGNPKTIDVGSPRNNYGSNVMNLMQCFQ